MSLQKEQVLLETLLSSHDVFAICNTLVHPSYFTPDLRRAVAFVKGYYDEYGAIPSQRIIEGETGIELDLSTKVTRDEIEYTKTEIEKFCRRKAIEKAVLAAPALIQKQDYGQLEESVKNAVSTSLQRDMGLSYFKNPHERMKTMAAQAKRVPFGWEEFDDAMNGGMVRTEIMLVSANSGGGKSLTLANMAISFLERSDPETGKKYNVLYLTLELPEPLVAQRFDTMFTGVPSAIWEHKQDEIASKLDAMGAAVGELVIKRLPSGTTPSQIRAYLKEFELTYGYIPDVMVVDYLDIMNPNENVSADNVFEKDKRATEQLRDVAFDYNMFILTASQQNRGAVEAKEVNMSHIAGGMSKVNTVDWWVSIQFTPLLKAKGEIGFTFVKTRSSDGAGRTVFLTWDQAFLRIRNRPRPNASAQEEAAFANGLSKVATKPTQRDILHSFGLIMDNE